MSRYSIDPQHAVLDALMDAVYAAIDAGDLSRGDADYAFDNAPESHAYSAADLDTGDDWDDVRDVVMAVGGRDMADKIDYWTAVLADLDNRED